MSLPSAASLPSVTFSRGFLAERVRLVRDVVIPYQWEALNDRIAGAERSGTVHNFQVAAGEKPGEFHGLWFQDSDLAKWLEAASYRLATNPDPAWEAEIDRLIATIAKAQLPDGYLDTYIQLVEPTKRWANLHEYHELYIAGHFIEAGVAHFQATGKRTLLDVVAKLADLIVRTFGDGPGQIPGYCGHEEVELALIKLARATGERRYAQQAAWFVAKRGSEPNYYEAELKRLGIEKLPVYFHHDRWAYLQAHRPPREQPEPVGHAVRAMYLYSAMADLALEFGDAELRQACRRLWEEIRDRHLYITGGVGAEWMGEKFSEPYDLPNDRAYSETCAGLGLIFFCRRLLELELRGEYADMMERTLYNNALAGMARDGTKFFCVNPLEVRPAEARRRYDHHHVKTQRVPWFGCACCPPNIARTLASLAHYTHSVQPDGIALHLYTECQIRLQREEVPVVLEVATDYPWDGRIRLRLNPRRPVSFVLRLRLPGWCAAPAARCKGEAVDLPALMQAGYLCLEREWQAGDLVELDFPMSVQRMRAHPRLHHNRGRVALQRGPLVFCAEEVDNGPALHALALSRESEVVARYEPELLGGTVVLAAPGRRACARSAELYSPELPETQPAELRWVPYALWGNRGAGEMCVWLNEC